MGVGYVNETIEFKIMDFDTGFEFRDDLIGYIYSHVISCNIDYCEETAWLSLDGKPCLNYTEDPTIIPTGVTIIPTTTLDSNEELIEYIKMSNDASCILVRQEVESFKFNITDFHDLSRKYYTKYSNTESVYYGDTTYRMELEEYILYYNIRGFSINGYIIQTNFDEMDEINSDLKEYITFESNMPLNIYVCFHAEDYNSTFNSTFYTDESWELIENMQIISSAADPNTETGCCYKKLINYAGEFTLHSIGYNCEDTFFTYPPVIIVEPTKQIPEKEIEYDDDLENLKFFLYCLEFGIPLAVFSIFSICFLVQKLVYIKYIISI